MKRMTTHIGLLRAVNLAGRNKIRMGDLRKLLTEAGMEDVRSLLQSGNLVFRSRTPNTTELESLLECTAVKGLGIRTDSFVRSVYDWETLVTGNPFAAEAQRDPGHLLVMFLKKAPGRDEVSALQKAITGREVIHTKGRHAYVIYPDGVGRSRLTTAVIEKHLGTRGTGRNWRTVLRLGALAGAW